MSIDWFDANTTSPADGTEVIVSDGIDIIRAVYARGVYTGVHSSSQFSPWLGLHWTVDIDLPKPLKMGA